MSSAAPAAGSATPILSVTGLCTRIRARRGDRVVHAVNDVSFMVARGEFLGIIGESGSGKSMTALSVMRLLPRSATISSGRIEFEGEDLLAKRESEMRAIRGQRMSMILQDPMVSLDPLFQIGDQMAESLRTHMGMNAHDIRDRAIALLESVGIPSPVQRLGQYPHQMSGGMLQRIVSAIALSCEPRLLIADEPTTALDPTVQAQFLDLLLGLREQHDLSQIVITHDFGVVAYLCDTVMVMYGGRIVERGTVRQIFDHPAHPYTQALLASIPAAQDSFRDRLHTIEGQPPDLGELPKGCAFAARCPVAMTHCREEPPPEVSLDAGHRAFCWAAAGS